MEPARVVCHVEDTCAFKPAGTARDVQYGRLVDHSGRDWMKEFPAFDSLPRRSLFFAI